MQRLTEPYATNRQNKSRPALIVMTKFVFSMIFFFLSVLFISPAMAKDIPLDSSGRTVFHEGGFVQTYPKIKQSVWMFSCERSDERGEECYEGGWKDSFFEHKSDPTYIGVSVFLTPELAQTALDLYEKKNTPYMNRKFKEADDRLEKYDRITDVERSVLSLPLSGFDSGFLNEYKRSYKKHIETDGRAGVMTVQSFLIKGAFRKGRVIFYVEKSVGRFGSDYQGDYWSYRKKSDPNQSKRRYQDNQNNKKLYALERKRILEFIPMVLTYTVRIEESWLAYYTELKNEFLGGKDYAEMSLAELVDQRAKKISLKSFNHYKRDMELRVNAMKNNTESMNPEFPSFFTELSSYEKDPWMMPVGKWYRKLKAQALTSKAAALDFAPGWERIYEDMNADYLYMLKKRLQEGDKLSDTRLKILRQGMIIWGTDRENLQIMRDHYSAYGGPRRTMVRESIFDILAMTGSSFGIRSDTFLSVETDIQNVKADGKSSSQLTISLFDQASGGNSSSTPLKGKAITIENVPFKGKPVGSVSHQTIETDSDGQAQVSYIAPAGENLPEDTVPRAKLIVRCPEFNLEEIVYIDLYIAEDIQIKAAYTILPAHSDFKNELIFRFENPDKDRGKIYKTVIRAESEHGRLASFRTKTPQQKLMIKARSGADNVISYIWDGPQPTDSAIEEKITIEIPELDLSGILTFSVGIDLVMDDAVISWKPPFQPHLTIPIKVYIKDRFHPDADLAQLFSDFNIEPRLKVEQTGFTSPAVLSGSENGEDELLSAVGAFLEQGAMGKDRPKSLTRDLVIGDLKKTKENQWLLVSKDLSGEGVPVDQMFPAIIPYVRGSFQVLVTLDPHFKGDALSTDHTKLLAPIDVSRMSARQGELEYFLLPSLKAVAGLTPSGSLGFGLTDIALKTRSGNYKGAIITAGQMIAGKIIGDGLSDKMKASYKSAMNIFYKEQTAKALGTTVKALHPKQAELALRLAKPYKLASWVDTVTGWALDQAIGALSPSSKRPAVPSNDPKSFLAHLGGIFLSQAHAEEIFKKDTLIDQTMDYLSLFTQGYGNEYGVIVITRDGLDSLSAINSTGDVLKHAPHSVFAGKDKLEMIRKGKNMVVIPFEKGKGLTLDMTGQGNPVKIYKILDNTVTKGILDYQGKPWKKRLNVNG